MKQTVRRIVTAKTTLTIRINRKSGPGSACRTSVGVSTMRPWALQRARVTSIAAKRVGSNPLATLSFQKRIPFLWPRFAYFGVAQPGVAGHADLNAIAISDSESGSNAAASNAASFVP
jgi:hypothetical protein